MTLVLLILSGFIILLLKIVSLEKYLKKLKKDIKQGFATQGDFLPPNPQDIRHCVQIFLVFWDLAGRRVLLASSRPGVLLNILQRTPRPPITQNYPTQRSTVQG